MSFLVFVYRECAKQILACLELLVLLPNSLPASQTSFLHEH